MPRAWFWGRGRGGSVMRSSPPAWWRARAGWIAIGCGVVVLLGAGTCVLIVVARGVDFALEANAIDVGPGVVQRGDERVFAVGENPASAGVLESGVAVSVDYPTADKLHLVLLRRRENWRRLELWIHVPTGSTLAHVRAHVAFARNSGSNVSRVYDLTGKVDVKYVDGQVSSSRVSHVAYELAGHEGGDYFEEVGTIRLR